MLPSAATLSLSQGPSAGALRLRATISSISCCPVRRVEVDELAIARPARHEQEPRIVRVAHQPHGESCRSATGNAVGGELRVELEFGKARRLQAFG